MLAVPQRGRVDQCDGADRDEVAAESFERRVRLMRMKTTTMRMTDDQICTGD